MALRAVHLWTCLAGAEGGQPLQPGGHVGFHLSQAVGEPDPGT